MTIAVFGGSFDPPHVGHVLAAHYVLSIGVANRVIIVPVFQHALHKALSPFDLRIEMCRAAFSGDERIVVSDIEATLSAPSYTLHTLIALRQLWPNEDFRLVVGTDVLRETEKWHEFAEVQRLSPLFVLGRVGSEAEGAPAAILPAVSSSEARKWCHAEASERERVWKDELIPQAVREIIERTGLYRESR